MLPQALGIGEKGCTRRLQRALSDFGFERSFARATAALKEHYGFSLPVSTTAKITHAQAEKIASELSTRDRALSLPEQGAERMVAEADGSFVPIVSSAGKHKDRRKNRQIDFKEARLCACQDTGSATAWYEASFEPIDQIGKLWKQCAKQAGRGINTQIHCLGDGATWIAQQARQNLDPKRYLVDFYHVCEYLGAAQDSCAENGRWLATQKNRLKNNRADRVLSTLEPFLEDEKSEDSKSPVRSAYRYLNNRLEQLDYAGAIAEGLPIGSGLIESGHKHVLQARLKISGASWNPINAENMIQARTLRANGLWNQLWANN